MQQKTTWMRYSIIGIKAVIFTFLISCSEGQLVEYVGTTNFVYKNLTSDNVELKLYNQQDENYENYSILPNSEVKITAVYSGSKTGVVQPFSGVKKLILKFETSNLCVENFTKLFEVKQYDNFSVDMYNTSNNTLIYNIDSEEFEAATTCN